MIQSITSVRPRPDESGEYFKGYIDRVPEGDAIAFLEAQLHELSELVGALPEKAHRFAYAKGKWSVNQLLGHVLDTERIFSTRCLWFARGNPGPLPGMDQDEFVAGADFDARSIASLLAELEHLRRSGILMFKSFDQEVLNRTGTASGTKLSVRALIFLIGGHTDHHLHVLRERYLPLLQG